MYLLSDLKADKSYDDDKSVMTGAVRFAAKWEPDPGQLFWAKATLGDIEVLVGTPDTVQAAYKEAIAKNERDWFALNSSRDQLLMLRDLGFRPDAVAAGIATFDRALARLKKPEGKLGAATGAAVQRAHDRRAGPPDAALPGGEGRRGGAGDRRSPRNARRRSAGPGIQSGRRRRRLAVHRGLPAARGALPILLPFAEPEFIDRSILPSAGGEAWRDRFFSMKQKLTLPIRIMPEQLGPPPKDVDPFERCNLWLLYSALACGIDKVRFIALWNGGGGDGPAAPRTCTTRSSAAPAG